MKEVGPGLDADTEDPQGQIMMLFNNEERKLIFK
jgi:hypothetical protein